LPRLLFAGGGLFVIPRWPRRNAGSVSTIRGGHRDFTVAVGWLILMTIVTLALAGIFTANAWDWIGAVYDPTLGGSATGALVALILAVGSAIVIGRMNAPLGDGAGRIYWLGCTASAILSIGTWFAAKEINWLGMSDSIQGGLWSGIVLALCLSAALFGVRRYLDR
jgi:hypothetical protein